MDAGSSDTAQVHPWGYINNACVLDAPQRLGAEPE